MELGTIGLGPNRQRHSDVGSFAVLRLHDPGDGRGPVVVLMVVTDEERQYTLRIGDGFPVGAQRWRLDQIEGLDTQAWTVIITRAD